MRLIRLLEARKPAATQIAVDCRISDETIVDEECAPRTPPPCSAAARQNGM
jgi:hypothetical protein